MNAIRRRFEAARQADWVRLESRTGRAWYDPCRGDYACPVAVVGSYWDDRMGEWVEAATAHWEMLHGYDPRSEPEADEVRRATLAALTAHRRANRYPRATTAPGASPALPATCPA